MRLLFTIPRLHQAGPDRALLRLIQGVQAHGHEALVAPLWADGSYREPFAAVGVLRDGLWLTTPARPRWSLLARAWRVARRVRRLEVDVWQSFHYTPFWQEALIARLAGIPYAMRWAGLPMDEYDRWYQRSRLSDRIVVLNRQLVPYIYPEELSRQLPIVEIPNGVDTAVFQPDATARARKRREMGWDDQDVVCIYTAKLRKVKGHGFLIEVFEGLLDPCPNLRLVMIGAGTPDDETALRDRWQASPARERITLLGLRQDIPELLVAADTYAAPSTIEGMSNALLEAMACGLPCVVTDAPWNWGIIETRRNGLLAPSGSLAAWRECLGKLAQSAGRRREMGAAAAATARERFALEVTVDRYLDLYAGMVSRGMRSRGADLRAAVSACARWLWCAARPAPRPKSLV